MKTSEKMTDQNQISLPLSEDQILSHVDRYAMPSGPILGTRVTKKVHSDYFHVRPDGTWLVVKEVDEFLDGDVLVAMTTTHHEYGAGYLHLRSWNDTVGAAKLSEVE